MWQFLVGIFVGAIGLFSGVVVYEWADSYLKYVRINRSIRRRINGKP